MSMVNVITRSYGLGYTKVNKWKGEETYNSRRRRELFEDQVKNPHKYQTTSPALVTRDYASSFMKR